MFAYLAAVITEEVWKCPLNFAGSVGIYEQFNFFFISLFFFF